METRFAERATPLAAVAMALAAFACCVPLGFAGALGVLALSSLFTTLQPWFLTVAMVLVAVAALQSYRGQRTCQRRRSRFSLAGSRSFGDRCAARVAVPADRGGMDRGLHTVRARYFAPAGIVVLLFVARAFLATAGSTPEGQPALAEMNNLEALKAEFNREAAKTRVIILLSPSCPYCLKGASEIERLLTKHRGHPLAVFNVWQPILATDWGQPGTGALHRLSDLRVRQFWDANHIVAAALRQSFEGRDPQPACCFQNGVWWDLMAVFPPGAEWRDTLPEPVLLEGTVEEAAPAFDTLLESK